MGAVSHEGLGSTRALVPPSEYAAMRTFFDRIRAAASAPIVLVKQ